MLLSKAIAGFMLELRADDFSPNTIAVYSWALQLLINFVGDKELASIGESDVKAFWAFLKDEYKPNRPGGGSEPLSPASRQNVWVALRSFYNFASRELQAPRADAGIKRPRFAPAVVQPFTPEQVQSLLKAASGKSYHSARNTAILMTMFDTGIRASELCRLLIEDLDLETGHVLVRPFGTGKKTKGRDVYVGKSTRKAIWRWLAVRGNEGANLFVTRDGRPYSRFMLRSLFARLGAKAGVPNAHPHRARHTFAVSFLRNGGHVFALQKLLGHSDLQMSQRYLALAEADLAKAHASASPMDKWGF